MCILCKTYAGADCGLLCMDGGADGDADADGEFLGLKSTAKMR